MIFEPILIIEETLAFEVAEGEDVGGDTGRGTSLETESPVMQIVVTLEIETEEVMNDLRHFVMTEAVTEKDGIREINEMPFEVDDHLRHRAESAPRFMAVEMLEIHP
jgi:hypothetical protein